MIRFACLHCKHPFAVSDDEAGGMVQCPSCGLLTDVPSHSDLPGLADDGTFKISGPVTANTEDPDRLDELSTVFRKARLDADGREIDLRNSQEDLFSLDESAASASGGQRYKPQYDPETGELVRPLELQPDPKRTTPADSIPIASLATGGNVIDYVRNDGALLQPPLPRKQLVRPANLAVMISVLVFLVLGALLQMIFLLPTALIGIAVWPFNVFFWLLLAHFGNTIIETGPEHIDELPRPLKSLAFGDDILLPLGHVLLAVLLCYGPAFLVLRVAQMPASLGALPLLLAGGLLFPAVLLTTTTSGNTANLQPGRIARVISIAGMRYWRLVAVWIVVFPLFLWVGLGVDVIGSAIGVDLGDSRWGRHLLVALPATLGTVYMLHWFCWELGLLYRYGHDKFGWVWQELARRREAELKQRGGLTAADRAAMQMQRRMRMNAQRGPGRA